MVKKKKTAPRKKSIKKPSAKKKAVKKTLKKKATVKKSVLPKKPSKQPVAIPKNSIIGNVTHYFPKVRAAVVKLKQSLAVGDTIKIKGHTTDFQETISSMQIDHLPVNEAKKGQEIGLLVNSRVRNGDVVYKQQ